MVAKSLKYVLLISLKENCRFEHPPRNQSFPNSNRFAPLQNPDNSNVRNNDGFHGGGGGETFPCKR
jgi:hypothetical protein